MAVALTASAGQAQETIGRALGGYQLFDSAELHSQTWNQLYELRFNRRMSDHLGYLLGGRFEDARGTALLEGVRQRTIVQTFVPTVELAWMPSPIFQTQLGSNLTWRRLPDARTDRVLDREYFRTSIRPELLPRLAAQFERRGNLDTRSRISDSDTQVQASIDQDIKKATISQTIRYNVFNTQPLAFTRRAFETQLRLGYHDSFLNERVNVSGEVLGSWSRLEEQTGSAVPISAPTQVQVAVASFATDDTPLDARDRPPVSMPILVDGEIALPSTVSIGPDGAAAQNLSLELGRFVTIDEIRVHVRAPDGALVTAASEVSWAVYTSLDRISWTQVEPARSRFNEPLSRYEVTLPPTNGRFFKVVSSTVLLVPALVTEVDVLYHTVVQPQAVQVSSVFLGNARLSVTARPMNELTLSYTGLANIFNQTRPHAVPAPSFDVDQSLGVTFEPFKLLSVGLRYQDRRVAQSQGGNQIYDAAEASLAFQLHANARVTVAATLLYEDNSGRVATTNGAHASTSLRLLPALRVSVDGGYQQQVWLASQSRRADRASVNGVVEGQLTRSLRLMGQASVARNRFSGGESEDVPMLPSRDERYSLEAYWRGSQQLALAARLGFAVGDQISGLIQRYRIDWFPFPEGSVRFGVTYDQDVDPYRARRSQRLAFLPHWRINRHAAVELSYILSLADVPQGSQTSNLFVTLTLTL